jgi:hypothetical protein
MAINIYDELTRVSVTLADIEAAVAKLGERVAKLEALSTRPSTLAPVSYFRADKLDADGKPAWDKVIAAKPALALINPGSGPGPSKSNSYAALVAKAQAAGVPIYGYVHTKGPAGYGTRPLAEVYADVQNHKTWHGVAGIFVDCTSNKPEHLQYYQQLCDYIHNKGLKVVLNAGTQCLVEHAQMADYVMCSEGNVVTYRARVPRAWEAQYASKLWHCVHSCPAADMPSVVALARTRGAGLVYVTNDVMPNPYDGLPAYWAELVAALAA